MRKEPTLRIPLGILGLLAALMVYGGLIARYLAPLIQDWPALAQTPAHPVRGVIWLRPPRGFVLWMETGRWR